jgi:hypothetical protein
VRGATWVEQRLPKGRSRTFFAVALAALVIVNLTDQIRAAASVADPKDTAGFVTDFARDAERHADRPLLVSARLAAALQQQGLWPRPYLRVVPTGALGEFTGYASFYSETVLTRELDWPTNRPGSFLAVFGPRDVNLDYYTGWKGRDRVICVTPALAREVGALPR